MTHNEAHATTDHRAYEREVAGLYNQAYSRQYRENDEEAIRGDEGKHTTETLRTLSESFARDIAILDLGCGTGRYFHCLRRVAKLTGIDISPHMLAHAKTPIRAEQLDISPDRIELICGDILTLNITEETFDLIYAIGVLAQHSPLTVELCNKLRALLTPGGKLFFTAVDVASQRKRRTLKRRLAERAVRVLPASPLKQAIERKLTSFYVSEDGLNKILGNSDFTDYAIHRRVSLCRFWEGAYFECLATKTQ